MAADTLPCLESKVSGFILSSADVPCAVLGFLHQAEIDSIILSVSDTVVSSDADLMVVSALDADACVEIREFCETHSFGARKIVFVNMHRSTDRSQLSLLPLLEVSAVKFVLFSEVPLLETVMSRCSVLRFLPQHTQAASKKVRVLQALSAVSSKNKAALSEVLRNWDEADSSLLYSWACESISRRFAVFSKTEVDGLNLGSSFAENLLEALGALRSADAKRTVYSILMAKLLNG